MLRYADGEASGNRAGQVKLTTKAIGNLVEPDWEVHCCSKGAAQSSMRMLKAVILIKTKVSIQQKESDMMGG